MRLIILLLTISLYQAVYADHSFELTKKQAKLIWSLHRESFYCGCAFDKHLNVDLHSCSYEPGNMAQAKRINWEHLVPVSWLGSRRDCWKQAKAKNLNPRQFCSKTDLIFRKMYNDLHNIVPAIMEVNMARSNYRFASIEPKKLFNNCDLIINKELRRVEPKNSVKGFIARAHLYMAHEYAADFSLSPDQLAQYQSWNKLYPPSAWERLWNQAILEIQGGNNRFITEYPYPAIGETYRSLY